VVGTTSSGSQLQAAAVARVAIPWSTTSIIVVTNVAMIADFVPLLDRHGRANDVFPRERTGEGLR
jgi:hypothetical protein